MITDTIINWFASVITFIVGLLPEESPSFTENLVGQVYTALDVGTLLGKSPVPVVIDLGVMLFVVGTAMTIIVSLLGAKVLVFLWQQVKW